MTRAIHRFDAAWREDAVLRDGTRVVLRLVQPDDKALLREGFQRLSPTSRYLRFFAPKQDLSEGDLADLTELDGIDRLAIGALRVLPDGSREGLGVARFARDPTRPSVAEAAITVVDVAQGKGLGTLLLSRLAGAARERGITCFAGEFLASNAAVQQLIRETCPEARLTPDAEVIRVEVPLDAGALHAAAPGRSLLRHAAGGRVRLRLRHLLLKDPERSL